MANTLIQIGSTVTVGSGGAASISFSSIPGTYTDLILKLSLRSSSTTGGNRDYFMFRINGSSGTNYSNRYLYCIDAGAPVSGTQSAISYSSVYVTSSADGLVSTFGNAEIYFPNYTSSSAKTNTVDAVALQNQVTGGAIGITGALWNPATQAAITSLTIYPGNGSSNDPTYGGGTTWAQYSTASLYGILKY